MDITPLIPKGRMLITGYGGGGFKINQEFVAGSLLVFPDRVMKWDVRRPEDITVETLLSALSHRERGGASRGEGPHPARDASHPLPEGEGTIELLLIGTGKTIAPLDPSIRQQFRNKNLAVDVMDTGAACRTYNILLSEERRVAAALIAV